MSGGIESMVPDPRLMALVDRQLIITADQELDAAEKAVRRAEDLYAKATGAAAAASVEWEQLRKRGAAGEQVTSQEVATIHASQRDAAVVCGYRADIVSAARAALEKARTAHADKIAAAHGKLAEAAIETRIRAARAADLATALYAAPTGGDEGRRMARKPAYEQAMADAKVFFEGASAALWLAVRAGWRGCRESFTSTWPTTETVERQQFGKLPDTGFRNTLSPAEKLELVRRHVAGVLEAARRLAQHDAVQERARVLRKKAEQVLGDNDLNRVPALVAELSTASAALEELATGGELVAA